MTVTPIRWTGNELVLLDQRRLPGEEVYVHCRSAVEVAEAIRNMTVRGAPAIGVSAAFALALESRAASSLPEPERRRLLAKNAELLAQTRPTAVNLKWAIDRMMRSKDHEKEAEAIFREDLEANHRIGKFGAELLGNSATVLTHCNAGALATSGYGTALGVIRSAIEQGKKVAVFADETRPYLQGARLTAWELQRDGIDVTLITDSMAGHFFQQGRFDAVLVGADRIAINGDTANKIGTYTLAVLANVHHVPFYVAAPVTTIDPSCPAGDKIPIEERSAEEVVTLSSVRIAPQGVTARHPAFDVTPARFISAIITDRGILRPPYLESIAKAVSSQQSPVSSPPTPSTDY